MSTSVILLAQTTGLGGFFEGFDGDQRFVLAIIGIGCATAITLIGAAVLGGYWSDIKNHQIEADLKRDMLDRGMSADEIQKVIEAKPQSGVDRWLGSWCKKG
jgi:hypothetical protein